MDPNVIKTMTKTLIKILEINATPEGQQPSALIEEEICYLIDRAIDVFKTQPCGMAEFEAPVTVCGDTHGQFNDVIRLFEHNGWPPKTRYLFLGDYVDRGKQSIETICLMFTFKIRYPNDFYILRGNHECPPINRIYGFYNECKRRYNARLWRTFQTAFSYMPICALVSNRVFCMHGGLSPSLDNLDQVRKLKLPFECPEVEGLLSDLLWSDPDPSVTGYQPSRRGISYLFGADIVKGFCQRNNIDLVARAHQVVENGYEFFADRKLITLFSAPNYCGEFDNSAGTLTISETLTCRIRLKPNKSTDTTKLQPQNTQKPQEQKPADTGMKPANTPTS